MHATRATRALVALLLVLLPQHQASALRMGVVRNCSPAVTAPPSARKGSSEFRTVSQPSDQPPLRQPLVPAGMVKRLASVLLAAGLVASPIVPAAVPGLGLHGAWADVEQQQLQQEQQVPGQPGNARRLQDPSRPQGEPTPAQIRVAQEAFRLFDARQLAASEKRFGEAISTWEKVNRPLDEVASLIKARGNVRTDLKQFGPALEDYGRVLQLMEEDGARLPDGTARYSEYPDTFVQRGLAYEGLADWEAAVADYTQAIDLWGGGRGPDTNPYALTFRGNALAYLGRYKQALQDYEAADDLFTQQRSPDRALDVRANRALVMYETGDKVGSVRLMKSVLRRQPGYADLHIAIAADAWGRRDAATAEQEWSFACQNTDVGCGKYKDMNWVRGVRRWPPSLARELENFLGKKQ